MGVTHVEVERWAFNETRASFSAWRPGYDFRLNVITQLIAARSPIFQKSGIIFEIDTRPALALGLLCKCLVINVLCNQSGFLAIFSGHPMDAFNPKG